MPARLKRRANDHSETEVTGATSAGIVDRRIPRAKARRDVPLANQRQMLLQRHRARVQTLTLVSTVAQVNMVAQVSAVLGQDRQVRAAADSMRVAIHLAEIAPAGPQTALPIEVRVGDHQETEEDDLVATVVGAGIREAEQPRPLW